MDLLKWLIITKMVYCIGNQLLPSMADNSGADLKNKASLNDFIKNATRI